MQDFDEIYKWAKENMMVCNRENTERVIHGKTIIIMAPYKGPTGRKIASVVNMILGVIIHQKLKSKEHIKEIALSAKVMNVVIIRHFTARNKTLSLQLLTVHIYKMPN